MLQYEMVIIFLIIEDIIYFESYNDVKSWEDFFFPLKKKNNTGKFSSFCYLSKTF